MFGHPVLRQTLVLVEKNLRIQLIRNFSSTIFRALILPIALIIFLAYAQNLYITPSTYGIGSASPVLSLVDVLSRKGTPSKVFLVNNNYTGGDIDRVIESVSQTLTTAGHQAVILTDETKLLQECSSTLRQATDCFAAAVFHSSPTEGPYKTWNYTIRADGRRGLQIDVASTSNDVQLYLLPFQHVLDRSIASLNSSYHQLPETIYQYPFTDETESQRKDGIRMRYQTTIRTALAVAFFVGQIGVIYHLVGFMSLERERGISNLLEAMLPNRHNWQTTFARLLSYHLSFVAIYLPGWLFMAVILRYVVYVHTPALTIIGFYLLSGLSLTSSALLGAAFFRRTRLSAITVTGLSLIEGIIAMVLAGRGNDVVGILSLFLTPAAIVNFTIELTYWEDQDVSMNLYLGAPGRTSRLPGALYWYCLGLQALVLPLLAAWVESFRFSTKSSYRTVRRATKPRETPIRLRDFSKVYRKAGYLRWIAALFQQGTGDVAAVKTLNMAVGLGQLVVLLGPNGSGKTTTLKCIAGLEKPSGGSLDIDANGGLGICPQENVFWDQLTVEEHVRILSALKSAGPMDSPRTIRDLICQCDLEKKTGALARTLSGGQKRKLQIAMMLTAGSSICCVDEVSSGLDPLSRRKIWEILLAERGRRTILLTTHFLDEADSLADRVVIISKGEVLAEGSSVELKEAYGGGYGVHLTTAAAERPSIERNYSLEHCADVLPIVEDLENRGIRDYRITGPTMENAFFNILGAPFAQSAGPPAQAIELSSTAPCGVLKGVKILLGKRLTILRRNYWVHVLATVILPVAGLLSPAFLHNYDNLACGSKQLVTTPRVYSPDIKLAKDFVVGPASAISTQALQSIGALLGSGTAPDPTVILRATHLVDTLQELDQYIATNFANSTPGGIFLGTANAPPTFAYLGNGDAFDPVFTQNILDNLLTNASIYTQLSDFGTISQAGLGDALQFIFYFGLATTTFAALFALYPTSERQQKIRILHYSSGLRALPLWIAYTIFDFAFALLGSTVAMILLRVTYRHWFGLGYLWVVLVLYCLSSIQVSYVVSLFTKSQLSAFAIAAGGQATMLVLYMVAFLAITTNSSFASVNSAVNAAHWTLAFVMPPGNLAKALLVSLNVLSIDCDGSSLYAYPGNISAYGGPILYLLLQSGLLFAFVVWWDFGPQLKVRRSRLSGRPSEWTELENVNTQSAANRHTNPDDILRVLNASKSFHGKTVVDDVTFGVSKNEVFALLGPNGAGKTTLMALVRGEFPLSKNGEILVCGVPISQGLASARSHIGFCPQFDAVDKMTVGEHLKLYANIKGARDVDVAVQQILELTGLSDYEHRLGAKLSGGYKRRLSLGMALIGNPAVLLLDEPSSGLDAVAKRAFWQILTGACHGRATVLTTHSMEEADACAHRAGILHKRMLALGTLDHLYKKFGNSYVVHLVTRSAPHTSAEEMDRLRRWILDNIDGAVLEEKSLHGQLKFSVAMLSTGARDPEVIKPSTPDLGSSDHAHNAIDNGAPASSHVDQTYHRGTTARTIFVALENNREYLGLNYYSVAPSALEEVFFEVIKEGGFAEEQSLGRWTRLKAVAMYLSAVETKGRSLEALEEIFENTKPVTAE